MFAGYDKYNKENKMLMEQMQELRKKMQELNQNKEAELKGMLTPEQNAAYYVVNGEGSDDFRIDL